MPIACFFISTAQDKCHYDLPDCQGLHLSCTNWHQYNSDRPSAQRAQCSRRSSAKPRLHTIRCKDQRNNFKERDDDYHTVRFQLIADSDSSSNSSGHENSSCSEDEGVGAKFFVSIFWCKPIIEFDLWAPCLAQSMLTLPIILRSFQHRISYEVLRFYIH